MTDWGYRVAGHLARRLPPGMSGRLADALADLYVATHPRAARAVARRASPRETYRAFARTVLDFLRERESAADETPIQLDTDARRILEAARSDRRATLLVSGHFGPWEAALRGIVREVGPLGALAAPHRSRTVEAYFARHRAGAGVTTLSQGRPAAAALARLRAGEWIAALADRGCRTRRHVAGLQGIVPIDRAPLLLARRAGARVLGGVSWRSDEGALHVRLLEPFVLAPEREGLSLHQAAARLQRFFDEHVRVHPTQWYEWTEA